MTEATIKLHALSDSEIDAVCGGAADGITRLVNVASIKTDTANDEAVHGAVSQHSLVQSQARFFRWS
jgi:hypothetical protein